MNNPPSGQFDDFICRWIFNKKQMAYYFSSVNTEGFFFKIVKNIQDVFSEAWS